MEALISQPWTHGSFDKPTMRDTLYGSIDKPTMLGHTVWKL